MWGIHRKDAFNQRIYIDGFEVKLTDGSNQLLLMIVDDATRLCVAVPMEGRAILRQRARRTR